MRRTAHHPRLSKNENILINIKAPQDAADGSSIQMPGCRTSTFDMLNECYMSKWVKYAGGSRGVSSSIVTGVDELDNPPFWLILTQKVAFVLSPAVLKPTGFATLESNLAYRKAALGLETKVEVAIADIRVG